MNTEAKINILRTEPDASAHLDLATIRAAHQALPPEPKDAGTVMAMIARPHTDQRANLETARLSVDGGMAGDRWARNSADRPEIQLAVMSASMAKLLANGQPVTLFGDNLLLDLDLSAENLPAGTNLTMGSATLEVTPEPHDGCIKFRARFGGDALRFVSEPARRNLNRRGIYMRVIEDGEVRLGDVVNVIRG